MRPLYQKDEDIKNELWIANTIEDYWPLRVILTAKTQTYDALLVRAHDGTPPVAMAEFKCRYTGSTQFSSYMISKAKMTKLIEIADHNWPEKIPLLLFVGWPKESKIMYWLYRANQLGAERRLGRTDRDDPQDIELCYFIPFVYFKEFKWNQLPLPWMESR